VIFANGFCECRSAKPSVSQEIGGSRATMPHERVLFPVSELKGVKLAVAHDEVTLDWLAGQAADIAIAAP
jgi:hypothetical protein